MAQRAFGFLRTLSVNAFAATLLDILTPFSRPIHAIIRQNADPFLFDIAVTTRPEADAFACNEDTAVVQALNYGAFVIDE